MRTRPIQIVALQRLLFGCGLAASSALWSTGGASQGVIEPPPQETKGQAQEGNTGDDFVEPPKNLFQLMYQFKTAPGTGSAPGTNSVVTTDTANLRIDHRIDFAPQWELGLRADLPLLAKNPISSSNLDGDYLYGVGDADIQAALIYKFDSRWTAGFGTRLYAPTGGDLGAGRWQIMPGVAVRYALPEISAGSYLEPLLRYDASFGGDASRKNISSLQFAPTFNLGLPDRWFVTFFPSADIRFNYGDPVTGQTGRLFLPLDVRVGRKVTDNLVLSVETGVPIIKDYPSIILKLKSDLI